MAQPQGKRARKIVDSDDDEEDEEPIVMRSKGPATKQSTLPSRARVDNGLAKIRSNTPNSSPSPSPKTTPKKLKTTANSKLNRTTSSQLGTKTIYSFFNAATAKQASQSSQSPEKKSAKQEVDEIDDQLSESELSIAASTESGFAPSKKRKSTVALINGSSNDSNATLQTRQKFLKLQNGVRRSSTPLPQTFAVIDPRPWTEKFAPCTLEELVVHKKKVSDVRQWLEGSLSGHKYKRLLVLKGPTGSGKTATISVLSKLIKFETLAWSNPSISDFSGEQNMSISAQFEDFIGRGRAFGGLDMVATSTTESKVEDIVRISPENDGRPQVLLIEEFPSNVTRSVEAARPFRTSILQYLATPIPRTGSNTPLIMIISESVQSNSRSSIDNFTAHRLLGPEILHHPHTAIIEFNAVAQTFISKALGILLQKRSREVGQYQSPHVDVLKRIAEFGDVRNATSTLEFICSHLNDVANVESAIETNGRANRTTKPKKSHSKILDPSSSRDESLKLLSLRESSIGLFHAVGKIVYNKRVKLPEAVEDLQGPPQPPQPLHLQPYIRTLTPEVDLDALIDETGTDTSTFLSALHENYILSCKSAENDTEKTLDSVQGSLDALCDADVLSNISSFSFGSGSGSTSRSIGAGEGIRQSDIAFHVGTRGILFSLPYPVKRDSSFHPASRANANGNGNGNARGSANANAHKMFYPASLKLWRKTEEIADLVDFLTARMVDGTIYTGVNAGIKRFGQENGMNTFSQLPRRPVSPSPSASSTSPSRQHSTLDDHGAEALETNEKNLVSLGSGISATKEMILDRLPYMFRVLQSDNRRPGSGWGQTQVLKQIESIVKLTGVKRAYQDDDDEEDAVGPEAFKFENGAGAGELARRGLTFGMGIESDDKGGVDHGEGEGDEMDVRNLVLSDDDIEDD